MENLRKPGTLLTLASFVAVAGTTSAFLQPSCNLRSSRITEARFNTRPTRHHDTSMTVRMALLRIMNVRTAVCSLSKVSCAEPRRWSQRRFSSVDSRATLDEASMFN